MTNESRLPFARPWLPQTSPCECNLRFQLPTRHSLPETAPDNFLFLARFLVPDQHGPRCTAASPEAIARHEKKTAPPSASGFSSVRSERLQAVHDSPALPRRVVAHRPENSEEGRHHAERGNQIYCGQTCRPATSLLSFAAQESQSRWAGWEEPCGNTGPQSPPRCKESKRVDQPAWNWPASTASRIQKWKGPE